ncbi:MAG TPA: metallophosphoesterase, partial [Sphingomicrobium sp.]|nr:metallophosphoesterase [Sphingomicrobium sp.]
FAVPVGETVEQAVGRHELALDAVEDAGVDLLLAGHAHHASAHAGDLVTRAGGALVIQAGTATSTRLRGQNQSFNVIDIDGGGVSLAVQCWGDTGFREADSRRFEQQDGRWRILKAEEPAH